MPQQLNKVVRRGRRPGKNYFEEKRMVSLVQQYKQTNNQELYPEIYEGFKKIAVGMINKHYYKNKYIRTLYKESNGKIRYTLDDAVSNCIYQIFKSLRLFDLEKGKLFSYANRICKNTLKQMSDKHMKLENKEMTFSGICTETITDDNNYDESGFENINANNNEDDAEDIIDETSIVPFKPEPKNITIKCNKSLYIIYKYICYIYNVLNKYSENYEYFENLVNDIKYDSRVDFSFEKYYNNITTEDYKELLSKIENTVSNIKCWLETDYPKEIKEEPKSYEGKLSNRALQKIRKHFKTKLKKNSELSRYDVDDLISFIEFAIVRFEENI